MCYVHTNVGRLQARRQQLFILNLSVDVLGLSSQILTGKLVACFISENTIECILLHGDHKLPKCYMLYVPHNSDIFGFPESLQP